MTEYTAKPTSAVSVNGTSIDGKSKINSNGIEIKVKNIFKSYSLIVHFPMVLKDFGSNFCKGLFTTHLSPFTFHFVYMHVQFIGVTPWACKKSLHLRKWSHSMNFSSPLLKLKLDGCDAVSTKILSLFVPSNIGFDF